MTNDLHANLRIAVGVLPNQAGSAYHLAMKCSGKGLPVSLVGHFLGGGLAQIVGSWTGFPFISFNGPGMSYALKRTRINIFKPHQMARSRASGGDATGVSFRVRGDVGGGFGTLLGRDWVVDPNGNAHGFDNHNIAALRLALQQASLLNKSPWGARCRLGRGGGASTLGDRPPF